MNQTITVKPCRDCRNWNECIGKESYMIAEICWCRHQCRWLIENFLKMDTGKIVITHDTWPVETTGYTEEFKSSRNINAHAPYEKTLQVVAELHFRIDRTGKDGRLLLLEVLNQCNLSNEANQALSYVSGWRRRRQSYRQWKADRKQKNGQKYR